METLFDPGKVRDNARPKRHTEGSYAFLDRSSRPVFAAARAELERWLEAFPVDERGTKNDVRRRFQSPDPRNHRGAFWELYLARLFSNLGFEVERDPPIAGTSKTPDFRMTRGKESFLLEAVSTASGIVPEEGRSPILEDKVMEIVDSATHPNFFVEIRFLWVGEEELPRRYVLDRLLPWLDGLDPDDDRFEDPFDDEWHEDLDPLGETLEGRDDRLLLTDRGWRVLFTPVRRSDRDDPDPEYRLIGMGPMTFGMVDDSAKLADKLESKRKRYGKPGEPYVVAVLSDAFSLDEEDVLSALLGTLAFAYEVGGDRADAHRTRQHDGQWLRGRQTDHGDHVSAVLIGANLGVHSFVDRWPVLWPNPWATRPLVADLPFPRALITPGDLGKSTAQPGSGPPPREVFGLAEQWPAPSDD